VPGLAAHLIEVEHVEKMHAAQDQEDHADLGAEVLEGFDDIPGMLAVLECEGYEADVDQVEADDQQMVDAVGHRLVAVERIDQEDPAVLVQRPGHPDRQPEAHQDIDTVRTDHQVHFA
jgi:hypothetical protein